MLQFWITFILLFVGVGICERRWCMLRDLTAAKPQPYSWSRVQLAWWTIIILSTFIAILWKSGKAPTLTDSALVLLGISSLTTVAARTMDATAAADNPILNEDKGDTFFLDILSDHTGVSISRFQAVIFNFTFGIWFIAQVVNRIQGIDSNSSTQVIDQVMPTIGNNNLLLLGLSSATYAAVKMTEKKEQKTAQAATTDPTSLQEEPLDTEPAVG